jgi:hypothetical protein
MMHIAKAFGVVSGRREGRQRRDARRYCRYFRGKERDRGTSWKILMNQVADMYGIATDI